MRERKARSRFQIPRSLAALAAEHLERRVIEGRLKPGQRLVEQECAADLGLSRGTLREAFRILANSGLVEILPRKGARVVQFSKRDVEETYFLRKHLVNIATAKAAENMTDERLVELEKIVERMEEAVNREDLPTFFRYNRLFHETVLETAGLDRLRALLESLGKLTIRYRYLGLELPGRMSTSLKAHQETLRAFARRDGRTAGKVMLRLIETAGQAIVQHLFPERQN